jgi:primosomal protein N' (replication factor Y)
MPPYARLAAVIIAGRDEGETREFARAFARAGPHGVPGVRVWGPAEAQMYRLRGKYRWRFLVQADKAVNVQAVMNEWIARVKAPSAIDVRIDIDPQSFY